MAKKENIDYGFAAIQDDDYETCHIADTIEEMDIPEKFYRKDSGFVKVYKLIETHTMQKKIIIKKHK